MACIYCIALASAALLGVDIKGGLSSISFPDMTGKFGICPNWIFRRCSPFVDFFRDFHSFEHVAGSLVDLHLKIPAL